MDVEPGFTLQLEDGTDIDDDVALTFVTPEDVLYVTLPVGKQLLAYRNLCRFLTISVTCSKDSTCLESYFIH